MLIGYARVSTLDQNLDLQQDALTKAGCEKIFDDIISGGSHATRPGLDQAMTMLRAGDTLVVWKLDRLGRSVKYLVDLVGELAKQGIQFNSKIEAAKTLLAAGELPRDVAKNLGVSIPTLYRWIPASFKKLPLPYAPP